MIGESPFQNTLYTGNFPAHPPSLARNILIPDIACEACPENGTKGSGIIDLLVRIRTMSTRITCDMVVPDVFVVLTNRANKVTFHDLHVKYMSICDRA